MIKDYPLKINNIEIPFPNSPWISSHETIENVNVSEAGTDIVQVERNDKLSLNFSFQLPISYRNMFYSWFTAGNYLTVQIHNGTSYVSHQMRMRNYKDNLVAGAEQTSGVYRISFDLIEK